MNELRAVDEENSPNITRPRSVRSFILFHPRVTAVARKRPRSFWQKCRWQVRAKYAGTLHKWLCMKRYGAWLYGVHRTRRDGSSFMWHQRYKYTTSVDTVKIKEQKGKKEKRKKAKKKKKKKNYTKKEKRKKVPPPQKKKL